MLFAYLNDVWKRTGLRARQSVVMASALIIAVFVISGVFIFQQRQAMLQTLYDRQVVMHQQLAQKGSAIASTVALACERALAVKDFLFLAQILQTTQNNESDVLYAALVNNDGVALVHTDPTSAGKKIEVLAGSMKDNQVADTTYNGMAIIEVAVPLRVANRPWGKVCYGLSKATMSAALESEQHMITSATRRGILTTLAVSSLLLLLGIGFASVAAKALTMPLRRLMASVKDVESGTFGSIVILQGSPEVVDLARAFNDMSLAVRRRESALQEAFQQADEANRLKSEFLANISHELRTPLNSIINVPNALLDDFPTYRLWKCADCNQFFEPEEGSLHDTAGREAALEKCPSCAKEMALVNETVFRGSAETHRRLNMQALHGGRHLLGVVNDLLDFSKMDAGKMKLHIETIDVDLLIADLKSTMQSLAEKRSLTISCEPAQSGLHLQGDRVKLSQVLLNLLGNAIKFTPEGGHVSLAVSSAEPTSSGGEALMHFTVGDNGIGIPADKLEMIFEPFRQVDGSHTRKYGGTGLGLAISAQIVGLHRGRIWAESQMGRGSIFHVDVPIALEDQKSVAPAPRGRRLEFDPSFGQLTVVMVDDDPAYLELGSRVLSEAGIRVHIVERSTTAFEKIDVLRPNFVIMDIMMPDVSGLELLQQMKGNSATKAIPIVVSTAYYSNERIVKDLGGLWLPKPWSAGELAHCLILNNVIPENVVSLVGGD